MTEKTTGAHFRFIPMVLDIHFSKILKCMRHAPHMTHPPFLRSVDQFVMPFPHALGGNKVRRVTRLYVE